MLSFPLGIIVNVINGGAFNGVLQFIRYDFMMLTLLLLMILNPSWKVYKGLVYVALIAVTIGSLNSIIVVYNNYLNDIILFSKVRSFRTVINWS